MQRLINGAAGVVIVFGGLPQAGAELLHNQVYLHRVLLKKVQIMVIRNPVHLHPVRQYHRRGGPRRVFNQLHLAEKIPGPQLGNKIFPLRAEILVDAHRSAHYHIHAFLPLSLPEEHVALLISDQFHDALLK